MSSSIILTRRICSSTVLGWMFAKMNFLVVRIDIRARETNVAGWMNLFYWQACLCAPTGLRFLGADSVRFWSFVTESRLNLVWLVKAVFISHSSFFNGMYERRVNRSRWQANLLPIRV